MKASSSQWLWKPGAIFPLPSEEGRQELLFQLLADFQKRLGYQHSLSCRYVLTTKLSSSSALKHSFNCLFKNDLCIALLIIHFFLPNTPVFQTKLSKVNNVLFYIDKFYLHLILICSKTINLFRCVTTHLPYRENHLHGYSWLKTEYISRNNFGKLPIKWANKN